MMIEKSNYFYPLLTRKIGQETLKIQVVLFPTIFECVLQNNEQKVKNKRVPIRYETQAPNLRIKAQAPVMVSHSSYDLPVTISFQKVGSPTFSITI